MGNIARLVGGVSVAPVPNSESGLLAPGSDTL